MKQRLDEIMDLSLHFIVFLPAHFLILGYSGKWTNEDEADRIPFLANSQLILIWMHPILRSAVGIHVSSFPANLPTQFLTFCIKLYDIGTSELIGKGKLHQIRKKGRFLRYIVDDLDIPAFKMIKTPFWILLVPHTVGKNRPNYTKTSQVLRIIFRIIGGYWTLLPCKKRRKTPARIYWRIGGETWMLLY